MRRRPLGLPLRVIGAALLCSTLVLVVLTILLADTLLTQFVRGSFALNPPPVEDARLECAQDPAAFIRQRGSLQIFAYDVNTGKALVRPDQVETLLELSAQGIR